MKLLSTFISHKRAKRQVQYCECHPTATAPRHPSWHQDMAVATGRGPTSEGAYRDKHEAEVVLEVLGKEAGQQKHKDLYYCPCVLMLCGLGREHAQGEERQLNFVYKRRNQVIIGEGLNCLPTSLQG